MKLLMAAIALIALCLASPVRADQPFEPREGEAFFYANAQCSGVPTFVAAPNSLITSIQLRNMTGGTIGCVHVGPNTKVQLFENADFSGAKLILTRSGDNPQGRWTLDNHWQRLVNSVRVSGQ